MSTSQRKLHLQDGIDIIDPEKNKLVEIPPSYGEPPDNGSIRIQ